MFGTEPLPVLADLIFPNSEKLEIARTMAAPNQLFLSARSHPQKGLQLRDNFLPNI